MDFCCAVASSFSAHLGLVLSASGADLLLVFTEVQAGTLPGCAADLHSSPASFPLPETIPSGGLQHLCAGTEPHTDLWQKEPRGKPRKSFGPGYFPFLVCILLSSLPLLAIPIDAGVNVLFKQPPMAEKWRHMAGLYQGQMDSALTGQQGGQPRRHCPPYGAQARLGGGEIHPWMPQENFWHEQHSWLPGQAPPCPALTRALPPSHSEFKCIRQSQHS